MLLAAVAVFLITIALLWLLVSPSKEGFAPAGTLIESVLGPDMLKCRPGATLRRTALGVPLCCKNHGNKCGACEYIENGKVVMQTSNTCPSTLQQP